MANKLNSRIQNEIASIMPLLDTVAIPTVDPVTSDQQARYRAQGLSYISNNESIIPRDAAGNILMEEGSTNNPLLIIDPVTEQITIKSSLKLLDTNFQYYKFPVTINPINNVIDLDIDLDFESDSIAARYTIPSTIDAQGQPETLKRIGTGTLTTWFTNNVSKQQGFTRIPFAGGIQTEPGVFELTPSILNALRNSGKTIKFNVQIQLQPAFPNITWDSDGDQVSSTPILGARTGFAIRFGRTVPEGFSQSGTLYELTTESYGKYGDNPYPLIQFEYVIDLDSSADYDKYYFDAQTDLRIGYILTDTSWWKIDVINVPLTTSLTGEVGSGVYSFGGNSILKTVTAAGILEDLYERAGTGEYIGLMPEVVLNNDAVTSSNPTGTVSEETVATDDEPYDETYFPYGEPGVDGETRPYYDTDGNQISTFTWNADAKRWEEEE
jgi:hypothetical protein